MKEHIVKKNDNHELPKNIRQVGDLDLDKRVYIEDYAFSFIKETDIDEDDEGKITVRGEKKEDDIYITIEDNGMGMRKEVLENILKDNNKVPKHGSGVGVINVHSRIQLMFGEQYGLEIYSEPDEGTRVVIHIPAIPYTKENAEQLEMQKYTQGRDVDEKE